MRSLSEQVPPAPKTAERSIIGHSVEGRDIACFTVGHGPTHVVLAAAIHGNEVGTATLARQALAWVAEHSNEFTYLTFHVVPVANPDGYARAKLHPQYFGGGNVGRFNARNVDLNRNFPTRSFEKESWWRFGKDYREKKGVFCGETAGSEPETQTLINLVKSYDASVLWMLHNAGCDVMGNNDALSQQMVNVFSDKSGYRLVATGDWKRLGETGTAAEWCDEQKLAYIEVEGASRWNSDWDLQKDGIAAVIRRLNRAHE